jgi:hypothetical protein
MAAFDAAEISQRVRELAGRHEQLHERLSRVIGPVDGYESMTLPELAAYGLKKLGLQPPADDDDPSVVALEHALQGRSTGGMGAGMDAGDNFVTRYIAST